MNRLFFLALLCCIQAKAQSWRPDLETALDESGSSGKPVLLFFTVSEACDNCRRIERIVFESEEFHSYADSRLIPVRMDFQAPSTPEAKLRNLRIVEKYNKDGFFPWVVVLDAQGNVVGKVAIYDNQSPAEYVAMIQKAVRS